MSDPNSDVESIYTNEEDISGDSIGLSPSKTQASPPQSPPHATRRRAIQRYARRPSRAQHPHSVHLPPHSNLDLGGRREVRHGRERPRFTNQTPTKVRAKYRDALARREEGPVLVRLRGQRQRRPVVACWRVITNGRGGGRTRRSFGGSEPLQAREDGRSELRSFLNLAGRTCSSWATL